DGDCALYSAGAGPGDAVQWTGQCVNGYAEGLGTATFTHNGQAQSFTAFFEHGVIPDGHVITRWGKGWSYDGEAIGGRFNGFGILTTEDSDRFDGRWDNGKMNGFGVLLRANGERYAGDWKDDKPNGKGQLRHTDGSLVSGDFVDGKLDKSENPTKISATIVKGGSSAPDSVSGNTTGAPFGSVSGKTLTGVDGSAITLTVIEGGMELQVIPAGGMARKTTFTFMTDRMGTVVEDSGSPSAGSSVTGFFRLTAKGVEVRYADGHSAMLSAGPDGGVQMLLDGDVGSSCRAWYPAGHQFSDLEKKAALNAYATKLGLPVAASDVSNGCSSAPALQPATVAPATPAPAASPPPGKAATLRQRSKLESRNDVKMPTRVAKASYRIGDYQAAKALETVTVRPSDVHPIDAPDAPTTAISVPDIDSRTALAGDKADRNNASGCLKVDSDGSHWGFRNSCDFDVQFAYCMAGGSNSLTACGTNNAVTTSAAGSVAAHGFGALVTDTSLADKDASHNFRWIACGGGSGEVVARLDHYEPPAGRCERAQSASVK
ncbi:MAG TPA: hypothetical protein VN175_09700, partial [Rhizomicrobium sp.]|nr:hypothetical protein [Rhizomicrobium sp.]